jgi:hypothetical protein
LRISCVFVGQKYGAKSQRPQRRIKKKTLCTFFLCLCGIKNFEGQIRKTMKKLTTIALLFFVLAQLTWSQPTFDANYFQKLDKTHDVIALPNWGPYSKKYAGISHIPNMQKGLRFDVTALPGFYRNRVMVPNVLFESGYHPWDISADFRK